MLLLVHFIRKNVLTEDFESHASDLKELFKDFLTLIADIGTREQSSRSCISYIFLVQAFCDKQRGEAENLNSFLVRLNSLRNIELQNRTVSF